MRGDRPQARRRYESGERRLVGLQRGAGQKKASVRPCRSHPSLPPPFPSPSQSPALSLGQPTILRQRTETAPHFYFRPPLCGRHLQASCIFTNSTPREQSSSSRIQPYPPTFEAFEALRDIMAPNVSQPEGAPGPSEQRLLSVSPPH